jgi:hypothetical protein
VANGHYKIAIVAVLLVCLEPAITIPVFNYTISSVIDSESFEWGSDTEHLRGSEAREA